LQGQSFATRDRNVNRPANILVSSFLTLAVQQRADLILAERFPRDLREDRMRRLIATIRFVSSISTPRLWRIGSAPAPPLMQSSGHADRKSSRACSTAFARHRRCASRALPASNSSSRPLHLADLRMNGYDRAASVPLGGRTNGPHRRDESLCLRRR
jgi:hypothetical protein